MDKFGNFSKEDAMRIAQSDAGQKLMTILQQSDGTQLQNAIQQASAGNFEQAKNTLSALSCPIRPAVFITSALL